MQNSALISVVIRTFNRKAYLLEAIESVRNQTYRNFEIIVVDDGSGDGTIEMLNSMPEIRLIRQNRNGYIMALNKGIAAARGEFVAILDDDDMWDKKFLESCLTGFQEYPDAAMVYSDYRYFFNNDAAKLFAPRGMPCRNDLFSSLIYSNFIPIDAALIRTSVFDITGLFDEGLKSHDDWDMWLRILINGLELRRVSGPLVKIRKHGKAMTDDKLNMFSGALHVLKKHQQSFPAKYRKDIKSSLDRLANIVAVIMASSGNRSEAQDSLAESIKGGNYKGMLYYLIILILPSRMIRKLVGSYNDYLLKRA